MPSFSMANLLRKIFVNQSSGSEPGQHRLHGTGTVVLCTTAQVVGILSLFSNVKLDIKGCVSYYFLLNIIHSALQPVFGDNAYPVRMCEFASNAALGVGMSPLVRVGWARLFGLPVVV